MSAPEFADRVIEPPLPKMSDEALYQWLFDLWNRTGGFETYIVNLNGLEASVPELNTLVGIDTNTTVQAQLDLKFNTADAGTMATQNANNVNITGGNLINVSIANSAVSGNIRRQVGTSAINAIPTVSLYGAPTTASTIDGTENDLLSYEIAADSYATNGDYIEVEGWGTFAANANNKRVRLYFGATIIFDSTAIAANDGSWWISAKIARTSAANQKSIASILSSNALVTPTTAVGNPSEDSGVPITIQFTGEGAAADDITQLGMTVKWNAATT